MDQTSTEERTPGPPWLTWAPLGLWSAGILAALRIGVLTAAARRAAGAELDPAMLSWDLAGEFIPALGQAFVVGLATTALLASARAAEPERLARGPLAFTALLFWSVLSGWPLAPPSQRSALLLLPALDDALVQGALACVLALALWYALALSGRRFFRRLLAGPLALTLATLVGALLPVGYAWRAAQRAPTFTRRVVVYDFLEHPGDLRVIEESAGAPVQATVLTPVVAWETDSGDKPALRMAPPCRVELTVPALGGGQLFLRAAAGVHKSLYDHLPAGVERIETAFAIDVNGARAFETTITCERPKRGQWDPSQRVWHHAGGETGLPVQPGDVVSLSTGLVDASPDVAISAADLVLGFGGLAIEEQIEDTRTRATAQAPNIVLVVMDTLRADRMSCYGYERPTTPRLDRLASRGILFENAHATSSWTWPSTASILTGLPADAHGVTSNESCTLVWSLETLPEVLQESGYKTAGFSCNPLIAPERYFDQGFEEFDAARGGFRMSDEVAPGVLDWMDRNRGVRFFLYLHLADPHIPHRPHEKEAARLGLVEPPDLPEGRMQAYEALLNERSGDPAWSPESADALVPAEHQRWISEVYDASVATGDRWVGEILDKLDELGLADRTIVAFTSDHGEELLDRGRLGHGHTLYQELVHVPLILAGPGIPAGVRSEALLSNRHLAATLAMLGGAEMRDVDDGVFLHDVDGTRSTDSVFVQTEKGLWDGERRQRLYGLRQGDWFLHWRAAQTGTSEQPDLRLFQLLRDPEQGLDLGPDQTERAQRMLAELQRRLEEQRAFSPELRIRAGEAMDHTLGAIGYAGNDDNESEEPEEAPDDGPEGDGGGGEDE